MFAFYFYLDLRAFVFAFVAFSFSSLGGCVVDSGARFGAKGRRDQTVAQ
jgi:hypothetical protein